MGITRTNFDLIAGLAKGKRVLSLGYPDLVLTKEDVCEVLGVEPTKFTANGPWHRVEHPLPETSHVFSMMGATIDYVDIVPSRGCERVVDLNYPQDLGEYDLVLDCGTTEHCFNVGQALLNAAHAVRVGGTIFHCSPMSVMNHGFWNMNPTLFHDLYRQNGWEVAVHATSKQIARIEVPAVNRFQIVGEGYLVVVAKRHNKALLTYPTQRKYLLHPNLEAA